MKIDKTAKENTIKKIDQKFSSRIKKPDIIGYEIVDNTTMTGVKYMREPKEQQPPKWALELILEVKELSRKVDALTVRIEVLEQKVDAIMECPTIKRELKLKK